MYINLCGVFGGYITRTCFRGENKKDVDIIMKTCSCKLQRFFFSCKKWKVSFKEKKRDIKIAQNIDCDGTNLQGSNHNLCFGSNVYPFTPGSVLYKTGVQGGKL